MRDCNLQRENVPMHPNPPTVCGSTTVTSRQSGHSNSSTSLQPYSDNRYARAPTRSNSPPAHRQSLRHRSPFPLDQKCHDFRCLVFRPVSTYVSPCCTTNPSLCQLRVISAALFTIPRVQATCFLLRAGKTSSGRCAGHHARGSSCLQSLKSDCHGTDICLVMSPALRPVCDRRNASSNR